jgi:CAAX amino terminal protease family.
MKFSAKNVIVAILKIVFVSVLAILLASISASVIYSIFEDSDINFFLIEIFAGIVEFTISLLVIWFFLRFFENKKLSELGFTINGHWFDILAGIIMPLLIFLTGTAIILITKNAEIHFFNIRAEYLICSLVILVFAAATEELICRGYILNVLINVCGKNAAILISSLFFSAFHLFNPYFSLLGFLNIFLAGVLFGLLYVRKMNLWLPIAFHIFWNFFQSILGYNVSGMEKPAVFTLEYAQENIVNGGEFGFEGSLICSILLFVSILFAYKRNKSL